MYIRSYINGKLANRFKYFLGTFNARGSFSLLFSYTFGLWLHSMPSIKMHKPNYLSCFDSDPVSESAVPLITAFIIEYSWFLLSGLAQPSICV